jgi:hypothetical protein
VSIYFLLLLIMVLLLYQGIIYGLCYAPKKIKIISTIALFLMMIRYIALIILFIIKNQCYLYLLKPFVFTNLMGIPICGIITILIFSKDNKIKLRKILLICTMLGVAYCITIFKSSSNINMSNISGYIIELQFETYCYTLLLIINSVFLIKGIQLLFKKYSNKLGAVLIIIASCITLIAVIMTSISANSIPLLLGDISWIIALNYGLLKFKR